MGKVLVIDLNICNGCYNCQVACKDEHVGNDWSPIAKPQPDTGQFWNKITDMVRGQVPKVKVTYLHSICQHCDEAPCIPACNVDAVYRRDDGAVIIDPDRCRGNQLCLSACPYEDVIWFNDSLNIAQKCTFCAHLLDDGWTEPRCVDACPTGAFTFGDEDDAKIKALVAKLFPPQGTLPNAAFAVAPSGAADASAGPTGTARPAASGAAGVTPLPAPSKITTSDGASLTGGPPTDQTLTSGVGNCIGAPAPKVSPTPTPDPSPSPSPVASPTPGGTPKPTPTPTPRPSPTPTPKPTPTPVATPTPTPVPTPPVPTPTP